MAEVTRLRFILDSETVQALDAAGLTALQGETITFVQDVCQPRLDAVVERVHLVGDGECEVSLAIQGEVPIVCHGQPGTFSVGWSPPPPSLPTG